MGVKWRLMIHPVGGEDQYDEGTAHEAKIRGSDPGLALLGWSDGKASGLKVFVHMSTSSSRDLACLVTGS